MILFRRDTWSEIYHSLRKNKLRTLLTMIGVAWGMFLYVSLQGSAKAMENGFDVAFKNFATNGMVVWAEETSVPYKGFPRGRRMELTLDDVDALYASIPEIELIAPRNVTGRWGTPPSPVVRANKSGDFTVYGDYPIVDKIAKKQIMSGRFINEEDLTNRRKVCVIGKSVYESLFEEGEEAVGEFVRLNGIFFRVVGVYKLPNDGGFEDDAAVIMPFLTFQQMYNQGKNIGWMNVLVKTQYDIAEIEKKIQKKLRALHDVSPEDTQAFGGFNYGEFFDKLTGFVRGMQFLSWVVGILTIIAGIIAISSILLITVKERTKEIGIRRALGAKPGEIRGQILLESVFLTVISGLLGFMAGIGLLALINVAVGNAEDFPFYNPTVQLWNVTVSLLIMVSLGLLVGLIPAQRAVMIKPIEALRTE